MTPQRNPNAWSCLAAAFATVLDMRVSELIDQVGHDGGQVLWPYLPEPLRRRGFHIQEMAAVAWRAGFSAMFFERLPSIVSTDETKPVCVGDCGALLGEIMAESEGVVLGENSSGIGHALVWDGALAIDPSSLAIGPIVNFDVRAYCAVTKRA